MHLRLAWMFSLCLDYIEEGSCPSSIPELFGFPGAGLSYGMVLTGLVLGPVGITALHTLESSARPAASEVYSNLISTAIYLLLSEEGEILQCSLGTVLNGFKCAWFYLSYRYCTSVLRMMTLNTALMAGHWLKFMFVLYV